MTVRPKWRLQDRIVRARQEAGMKTQGELATALYVDPKTISRWEAGLSRPRRRDLMAIAQVTGVDLDWLAGDDDETDGTPVRNGAVLGVHIVRSANSPASRGRSTYHATKRGPGRQRRA